MSLFIKIFSVLLGLGGLPLFALASAVLYSDAPMSQVKNSVLIFLVTCLGGIAAVACFISYRISKRFNRLLFVTQNASAGDFSQEIEVNPTDEIGQLEKAFDRIYSKLREVREHIIKQTDSVDSLVEQRVGELKETQSNLLRTAHMAGMAEVATGILHNIGNINTSINVRLEIIQNSMEKLSALSLSGITAILDEHRNDLQGFFAKDPRAPKIIEYLRLTSSVMEKHYQSISTEVAFLFVQLSHINEIIHLQQRYAKGDAKVWELCFVDDLIKDAVLMLGDNFNKHLIELVVDLSYKGRIPVNRPQIIQVFVNLLKNAAESIERNDTAENKITITDIPPFNSNALPPLLGIQFIDTGKGLPAESFDRIFSYGYTTKVGGGKGYGLHYSANYIHSIGGRIDVASRINAPGAVFTVWLPTNRPGNDKEPQK